ncbi:MAG: class I SAM-dependent methyltransferase [Tepidiformaceae bacterium]
MLNDVLLGDDVLEIGPGPGLTTDILRERVPKLTALEYGSRLADRLRGRLAGTNVTVITGDATEMTFETNRFSAVASFTMLHHVPSQDAQDALLREAFRVLRPGGLFLGSDSRSSLIFRVAHLFDTMVLVDPDQFGGRLERTGFGEIRVDCRRSVFRFSARKPRRIDPFSAQPPEWQGSADER